MVGTIGHGKCFDCGVEPTGHRVHFIAAYVGCVMARPTFRAARASFLHPLYIFLSWVFYRCKPFHYWFSYVLGIVRYRTTVDETCSDRGKLVFTAAQQKGLEIQQVTIYRKPTEVFRVRFPKDAHGAGIAHSATRKTQWVYFDALPLVPWRDRSYTQWIDDKLLLKEFFSAHHIAVPECHAVTTLAGAQHAREMLQARAGKDASVVVKPRQGSRSRHTTIDVRTEGDMRAAYAKSHIISHHIVVEEQLFGKVCRATLIEGKLVGFTAMTHPSVVGDGVHTIAELITERNEKRNKRVQSEMSLEHPDVYPLAEHGYTLATVLPHGQVFELKQKAGWMYGGDGREMLNDVHPQLVKTLERAATLLHAQLVAFDLIIEDPESDPAPQRWGIIEANSVPYIEVHIMPTHGERINVALQLWDMWADIPWGWR